MTLRRVLVIGVGSIGERHVRCFQATGRARVSVCDVDDALRERIVRQYGIEREYGDWKAAADESHDAAVIAVPAHLHVPIAAHLAARGIDLLIEKPLSTVFGGIDVDAIETMLRSVEEHRVRAGVAYVLRHHPALCALRGALREGRFGRPLQVVAVAGQHFPTYRPAYREVYYANRSQGGGAIQDAITHLLNAGEWLVGPMERLVADASHQALEGVDVEDTVHLLARQGHVLSSYNLNQYQAPHESTVTVVCQGGTCRAELHRNAWSWMTEPGGVWHEESLGALDRDELFIRQANAFLDVVEGRAEPACSLDEAYHTLRVCEAAMRSVETRTWQEVEPS